LTVFKKKKKVRGTSSMATRLFMRPCGSPEGLRPLYRGYIDLPPRRARM
jgi:hypothetical protein